MWQGLLVGLIVLLAAIYSVWALVPSGARHRAAASFVAWSARKGRPAWLARFAATVERAARAGHGACGDCSASSPQVSARSQRGAKRD